MTPRPISSSLGRMAGWWPWIVASVPALVMLAMLVSLRVRVPSYDSWAFVEQYLRWVKGGYGWQEFFAKHGDHPSAVGKAIYFAVLHYLHGEVGILVFLSWALMLVVAICACVLSRPVWAGNRMLGAVLMFCLTFTIFSAGQAAPWIWDFTYQNLISGACLATGVLLLTGPALSWWLIAVAALLSLTAIFSVGGGFLVGALFSIPIWRGMTGKGTVRKCLATGAWLAGVGIAAAIALKAFGHAGSTGEGAMPGVKVLFDRPLLRFQFVLMLLGQMFGKGMVFEPDHSSAVVGAILLIVFIACTAFIVLRRNDSRLVSLALPWIIFPLFGLASAVLICIGRLSEADNAYDALHNVYALSERTFAERFTNLTLFFAFGVIMLAAVVVRSGDASSLISRWIRRVAVPALTVFIFVSTLNWSAGWQNMKIENRLQNQERAMLGFGSFLRLEDELLWSRQLKYHTYEFAKSLADTGKLRGVDFVPDSGLSFFERRGHYARKWATFDPPVELEDGRWWLTGTCAIPSNDFSKLPDLVVITAEASGESERIVAISAPQLPETFLERQSQRRKYPDHYFGWSELLGPSSLRNRSSFPTGRLTLRAYVLDAGSRVLYPITGIHKVNEFPDTQQRDKSR